MEKCEKYLIRKAFDNDKYLPKEILYRRKEAFSDGVSNQSRSWYQIIQEKLESMPEIDINESEFPPGYDLPKTKEQKYYYSLFKTYYPDRTNIIPYYWMPKFVDATDSSARTLELYNN